MLMPIENAQHKSRTTSDDECSVYSPCKAKQTRQANQSTSDFLSHSEQYTVTIISCHTCEVGTSLNFYCFSCLFLQVIEHSII